MGANFQYRLAIPAGERAISGAYVEKYAAVVALPPYRPCHRPTAERGGRAKAFFRLTPKGLREVRETQTSLTRLWDGLPI